ncbi:MAG TPA: ribonuclease HII [Deinococcales bacterium]|nr:ribonuclease HII [Deinococcales bacterium]
MAGWELEAELWERGAGLVAGVDEAGRGAWAGPVAVAAVILPPDRQPRPYRDSKTLSPAQREELAERVRAEAVAWRVELAAAGEVDEHGVLAATMRAARRAVAALHPRPDGLVTDYLRLGGPLPILTPARADSRSYTVAAASILAKTARDAYMRELHDREPAYGFASHKGYGVAAHAAALRSLGPCGEHRRSFAPVREAAAGLPHLTL